MPGRGGGEGRVQFPRLSFLPVAARPGLTDRGVLVTEVRPPVLSGFPTGTATATLTTHRGTQEFPAPARPPLGQRHPHRVEASGLNSDSAVANHIRRGARPLPIVRSWQWGRGNGCGGCRVGWVGPVGDSWPTVQDGVSPPPWHSGRGQNDREGPLPWSQPGDK